MRTLLLPVIAVAFLGAGCERPAEPAGSQRTVRPTEPATPTPAGVVTIPEEFQSPTQTPLPATPKILFAVKNFQVKTGSGIQGIMAGETVNVIREVRDDVVVQYGELEFTRPQSFFSPTFVGSNPPQEVPAAVPAEPAETIGLAAPVPAAEPVLPEENFPARPLPRPPLTAGEKKMAELADSIRALNEKIRTAQANAGSPGKQPTRAEKRALEQMKADRDELSLQLTTLGKP
ncbi:MAG: hypothetical protein WCQ16_00090 [Verrucomicrobiae bacterium]